MKGGKGAVYCDVLTLHNLNTYFEPGENAYDTERVVYQLY
jgi:hypothetical protein